MAELPEIMVLTRQISENLSGKRIEDVEVIQEKCLNRDKEEFIHLLKGKRVISADNKGKWIIINLSEDFHLLINLGMGADLLYYSEYQSQFKKYQCRFHFADQSGFICKFWWFGYLRLLTDGELQNHNETRQIALSPLDPDFTREYLRGILKNKRSRIKNFILNQKKVGGIGNMYIHDILFKAGLHPTKTIDLMKNEEIDKLYDSMVTHLKSAYEMNGCAYERDLFGHKGRYSLDKFLVGYKENRPCPVCSSKISKIKTGSNASFICPKCQPL